MRALRTKALIFIFASQRYERTKNSANPNKFQPFAIDACADPVSTSVRTSSRQIVRTWYGGRGLKNA